MTRSLLLVTGSRALSLEKGGSVESERWAKQLLEQHISMLTRGSDPRGADLLVHGDCAHSPDVWADEIAAAYGINRVAYPLDGWVKVNGKATGTPWIDMMHFGARNWPLLRNEAMVNRLERAKRLHGDTVLVLALRAPWANTNGTAHCARVAGEAGLEVRNFTCPVAMANRNARSVAPGTQCRASGPKR